MMGEGPKGHWTQNRQQDVAQATAAEPVLVSAGHENSKDMYEGLASSQEEALHRTVKGDSGETRMQGTCRTP